VCLIKVIDDHDIAMIQGCRQPRLTAKASDKSIIARIISQQKLDRDAAADAHLLAEVDRSHSSFAQFANDLVAPFN
jgi:hypothetical protein